MKPFNPTDMLWQALAIFLLIGAIAGVVVSLLLLFKPQLYQRVSHVGNSWVSTRHVTKWMDHTISIEQWFYRHHRPMGLLVVLAAGYMLMYFGWEFDKAAAMKSYSVYLPNKLLLDMLLQVMVLMALIGGVVALVTGLFVGLRPSLLRGFEKQSNKWQSLRRATKEADVMRDEVDPFMERHAQRVGWLLLLGSIYLFFLMFRWLL